MEQKHIGQRINVTRTSMPPYEEYIKAIRPLWDSHWLTNMGEYHNKFENRLKEYLDVPELSLMVNGHMALEMTIQAFGFPKGSEVVTTPFTFISTTHAIVRNGLDPIFCDIKFDDYTIDETKIEELITEKTVAIVPVHVYGNVCNVEEIDRVAKKYDLKVIYDAAHAFGVKYKNISIGNFGDAAIFSFHATKLFNSIEGGALATGNIELLKKLYDLKNFGIRSEEIVVSVGANAKMNEFQAIMGLCNLDYIEGNRKKRKKIVKRYREWFEKIEGIKLMKINEDANHNFAYFPIIIDNKVYGMTRDELYEKLMVQNIYTRKYFYPITSDQACFKNRYKNVNLTIARYCASRVLLLPLYPELADEDIDRIAGIIKFQGVK
ncbi:MAG: DegT/DnrJ/EryC1/StrS family aminotransferase [Lachnospiraceae bacterium]|nr:DegT/DnrJ/EryC1/StrS family aminotransferase [Lachnospiraceae bacterium]